jgi:hypothetical protein
VFASILKALQGMISFRVLLTPEAIHSDRFIRAATKAVSVLCMYPNPTTTTTTTVKSSSSFAPLPFIFLFLTLLLFLPSPLP